MTYCNTTTELKVSFQTLRDEEDFFDSCCEGNGDTHTSLMDLGFTAGIVPAMNRNTWDTYPHGKRPMYSTPESQSARKGGAA